VSEVSDRARRQLHALAHTSGIEVRWRAQDGSTQTCSDDTLITVLQLLRVDIQRPEDARRIRAELALAQRETLVEPVVVAWDGAPPVVPVRLAGAAAGGDFAIVVETEANDELQWTRRELRVRQRPAAAGDGDGSEALLVDLPHGFAPGRHRLRFELGERHADATLIAAPTRINRGTRRRDWGVFAPLYALHDRGHSGAGDLGTLDRFAQWTATRGGTVVGTLPILAMFVGHGKEPCEPSPYAPVSRHFWNELYLDLAALPELAGTPDPGAAPVPTRTDGSRLLDLPGLAATRRPLLETAAARARETPARLVELERWLEAHTEVRAYSEFRAATEGGGRDGVSFHEYAQFALAEQLTRLAGSLEERGQSLYIDLPVGTHRDGYDVAARPDLFATGASVGAPPDDFQPAGQNWGFPPLDPVAARADGHGYIASCLDEQLRYARLLRLDHVMGLHRLWMIPAGAPATEGAYVHYPAEEHWATICMVAQRHQATIVGENLGTVPPATNRAMRRHRALGIWVAQFDVPDEGDGMIEAPGASVLACLDTHDLATFATWWRGLEPGRRDALLTTLRGAGELDAETGEPAAPDAVLAATLAWLGSSRAPIVLATLEDLWLEPQPQNIPGSEHQREAFRRRAAHGIDELDGLASVTGALDRLARARKIT
jgi:4-alpha-glucanotransferase